ncbi:hypothetical protein ACTHGU_15480 [Chitinophagaceae bacterium MMS25-I14]
MNDLKEQLYHYCRSYLEQQQQQIQSVIAAARESAANETKSSAGDKYETAREMLQQDIDRASVQLSVCRQMQDVLAVIDINRSSETVIPGSVVRTGQGNYFIAIPAGKTVIGNETFYIISAASPAGAALKGKKAGDTVTIGNKTVRILEVW